MARSLAERLRAHEQQKARLAEQAAKLKYLHTNPGGSLDPCAN